MKKGEEMTHEETKGFLRELIVFMTKSEQAFDMQVNGEARRLALCVRTIVQDTPQWTSVLTRLGLLSEMYFLDESPDFNPQIGLPLSGLAIMTIGKSTHRYMPRLGTNPERIKQVPFGHWWKKPVIVDPGKNISLDREAIIVGVSCSNVGTTDNKLDDEFAKITERAPQLWCHKGEGAIGDPETVSMLFASVRQISFELLEALTHQHPEFF